MRAFIVRPFSSRQGVDFGMVQQRLIDPALAAAGIAGDTTMQFVEAGNIRVDMFEQLLLADLVIADVSVHNANVFYELGIRHALRSRQTILIRARVTKPRAERTVEDDVPFDLRTDRYLEYDHEHPEASLDELTRYLRDTGAGERTDSPVFLSLPSLAEQDRSRLSPVPRGFLEEAELACDQKDVVHLGLLAAEAADFTWEMEGWRTVGKMQLDLGAYSAARRTLERVRKVDPGDLQANLWLGTVYQRLGDFTSSDQALDRVVEHPAATRRHKSEAFALKGSNEKQQWVAGWIGLEVAERGRAALASPGLQAASDYYERALSQDLNSFYPALVALSLVTIRKELIDRDPAPWKEQFGSEAEEIVARDVMLRKLAALAGAARLALDSDQTSEWRRLGMADYQFLTAEKPGQALSAFRRRCKGQAQFKAGASRRHLQIFADLQLKADRIKEILAMFATLRSRPISPALARRRLHGPHGRCGGSDASEISGEVRARGTRCHSPLADRAEAQPGDCGRGVRRRHHLSRGLWRAENPDRRAPCHSAESLRQHIGGARRTAVGGQILGARQHQEAAEPVGVAVRDQGIAGLAEAQGQVRDLESRQSLDARVRAQQDSATAHRDGAVERRRWRWSGRNRGSAGASQVAGGHAAHREHENALLTALHAPQVLMDREDRR